MSQLLTQLTATDLFGIGVGIALILFGRKLYWLALGGLGFFLGLWLADHSLHLADSTLGLGLGFLLGVLGAVLAVVAQRIAIGLGGFVLGGAGALWAASWLAPAMGWQGNWPALIAAVVGAVVGVVFASVLFEAALIVFSSLIGASLITTRSGIGPPHEGWLFLILLAIGVMAQSRSRRRRARRSHD